MSILPPCLKACFLLSGRLNSTFDSYLASTYVTLTFFNPNLPLFPHRFMIAAINRGQDFAKTSMNVALSPTNGTINIAETITTAVRCVRHLLSSGSSFKALPTPPSMCNFIITDGHWLLENMLCLLSNASKYSFTGDITMAIELIPSGTCPTNSY